MASGTKGIVLSTIDARRGNVFGCILDTNKDSYIVDEAHTLLSDLKNTYYEYEVSDTNFKVDPFYVISHKVFVDNPDLLVPNYLRETEAERNLNDKAI